MNKTFANRTANMLKTALCQHEGNFEIKVKESLNLGKPFFRVHMIFSCDYTKKKVEELLELLEPLMFIAWYKDANDGMFETYDNNATIITII